MNTHNLEAQGTHQAAATARLTQASDVQPPPSKYARFANHLVFKLRASYPSLFRGIALRNKINVDGLEGVKNLSVNEVIQVMEDLEPKMKNRHSSLKDAIWAGLKQRRVEKLDKTWYDKCWQSIKQQPSLQVEEKAIVMPGTKKTTCLNKLDYYPPSQYQGVPTYDEGEMVQEKLILSYPPASTHQTERLGVAYQYKSGSKIDPSMFAKSVAQVLSSAEDPDDKVAALDRMPELQRLPGHSSWCGDGVVNFSNMKPASQSDEQRIALETKKMIQQQTQSTWCNILTCLQLCSIDQLNCDVSIVIDGVVAARTLLSHGSVIAQDKFEKFLDSAPSKVVLAMTKETASQFAFSKRKNLDLARMIQDKNITFLVTGKNEDQLVKTVQRAILLQMFTECPDRLKQTLTNTFQCGGTIQDMNLTCEVRQVLGKLKDFSVDFNIEKCQKMLGVT